MGQITPIGGKPKVVAVNTVVGGDETEMLPFAATLEKGSEHPLAGAIVNGAVEKGLWRGDCMKKVERKAR
jgi:P-type Cu+ transporter